MQQTQFLNLNGKIFKSDALLLSANNRSFRYGDGCFETIKAIKGKLLLEAYHFERLFASIDVLQFEKPKHFTLNFLRENITELLGKNKHLKIARARLTIFRGKGGLYDAENNLPNFLIETWALNESKNSLNENGLMIDIYKDARKACDNFAMLKSNNFLVYAMAAMWAKKNKLNDALVLNSYERLADATIANLFIVKDGIIKTPAITEGCINGVMRRHLLKHLHDENMPVEEKKITIDDVLQASEIFLSNAIQGIKWVKNCGSSNYTSHMSLRIYNNYVKPLFEV